MRFIKKNSKYIGIVMVCIFCSYLTTLATNYVFDSSDVRFDNSGTEIQAGDVQGAIDETFRHLTDYNNMNTRVTNIENNQVTFNSIYPVGSIYISVENTNPSSLFGGTWVSFGSGRTLIGVDTNDTSFDAVEETGGAKTATLETDNLPSHSHYYTPSGTVSKPTFTGTAVTSGANSRGHTHSVTASGTVSSTFTGSSVTTSSNGAHKHLQTLGGTLSTVANVAGLYVIGNANNSYTGEAGAHTHTVTAKGSVSSSFTGKAVTSGGESQNHTHSVTAAGSVSQPTFTGTRATTETTGNGTAFSTVDPYITVYMWKRTA